MTADISRALQHIEGQKGLHLTETQNPFGQPDRQAAAICRCRTAGASYAPASGTSRLGTGLAQFRNQPDIHQP
jgi:hypothetical protein